MRDWLRLNRPALPAFVLVAARLALIPVVLIFVGLALLEFLSRIELMQGRISSALVYTYGIIYFGMNIIFLIRPKLAGATVAISGAEQANLGSFEQAEKHYRQALSIIGNSVKETHIERAAIAVWILTLIALIILLPLYFLSWVDPELPLVVLGWAILLIVSWAIYDARRTPVTDSHKSEGDDPRTTETENSRNDARKEVIELSASNLGAWDCYFADLLSRLAFVTRMQGNFDDAEQFAKRAVAMHEKNWGETHSRTLASRDFLARLYLEIARYKEADALLQVTLQRRESTGAGTTVEAAQCLNDLGRSAAERSDHGRAELLFRRAYDLVQSLKVDDTPPGVAITYNLVHCLTQIGRYDEADALIKTLLQRTDRQGSPDSLLVASSLYHLALIKLLRNEPDAAEPIARRALATLQAVAAHDGGRIATFNGLIGRILMKQKRFAEAEPLLKALVTWREEYLAPEHPLLAESLEFFGELLRSQGGFLESADYYHRAKQIRDHHFNPAASNTGPSTQTRL